MNGAENESDTSISRDESKVSEHEDVDEWVEHYDETYSLHYYVNTVTGECYWGNPADTGDAVVEDGDPSHAEESVLCGDHQVALVKPSTDELSADDVRGLVDSDHETKNDAKCQFADGPSAAKRAMGDAAAVIGSPGSHDSYPESASAHWEPPAAHSMQQNQTRRKLDYAALWREYYADTDADGDGAADIGAGSGEGEQYNPYAYEWDLEEGLEYPAEDDDNADEEEGDSYDHFQSYEPYNEESAPKTVKNRSKDVQQGSTTQDYIHMARMYKLTRPYSDPSFLAMCVLCHTNFANMVFFPCEHRCVCSECVEKEHICSDRQMDRVSDGYCNCSLCAAVIKLILPSEGGAEVDKYWTWVYEEPVKLPNNFLRNFKHSAAVIRAVHVRNPGQDVAVDPDSFENASKSCTVS